MTYYQDVIYATCGAILHLKFVESFTFTEFGPDLVIEELADDRVFTVRSVSGKDYVISTKYISSVGDYGGDVKELAKAIFERWKRINHRI